MKPEVALQEATPRAMPAAVQAVLRAALQLMRPMVRWLVRNGVTYPAFAQALKDVFVGAAREELDRRGQKVTASALSVLSGVHRKDVRAEGAGEQRTSQRGPSAASQIFTRWLTDPAYRLADTGAPAPLARGGAAPSFESLARQVSSDVHPRTLLQELERLGLVRLEGELVLPRVEAFVPSAAHSEMNALLAANVGDHLRAAVHNLTGDGPRMLEQSVFASGLSPLSAEQLGEVARELWADAFSRMVAEATRRVELDADQNERPTRMRFGVYYYQEPQEDGPRDDTAAAPGSKENS
jgi:hypothetical protein